jgi:hypothetical protein
MIKIWWAASLAIAAGCGSDPVDAEGDYTIAVTNRENGCDFESWTEGESSSGIPLTVTQNDSVVTGEVGGAAGLFLGAVLGSNVFEGEVSGDEISMTLFGTTSAGDGNCTYTVNAVLDAELDGDVLTGEINYTAATNDNPDCAAIEGCATRQELNGTRPPQ